MEEQKEKKLLTPGEIKENIDAGRRWLRSGQYENQDARWKQWERNKKSLQCRWPDSKPNDVAVNTIFSNYWTTKPKLYFRNPKIKVTPRRPMFKTDDIGNKELDENGQPVMIDNYKLARLFGLRLNYELKEIKFKDTLQRCLGDCLNPYGIGWIKWGYSVQTLGGNDNNRDRKVTIWGKRVDPRLLVYDWMATTADDCRFFSEMVIGSREEFEEAGFVIPSDYVSSYPDWLADRHRKASSNTDPKDLIIVHEYHDEVEGVNYWMLDNTKQAADDTDWPRQPEEANYPFDGSCYVPLVLNPDNDDIIGLSDAEPVEDQAKAINRLRTKQTNHTDYYGVVTHYEEGAILDENINKALYNDNGMWIKVQQGMMGKVQTQPPVPMGQDAFTMSNVHLEDMRTTLGLTEYEFGSTGDASTKATTSMLVDNSSKNRAEARRDAMKDFVIENIRRLSALVQTFGSENDFVNVADEKFDEQYVDYLKKEFGFNPEIPFLHLPTDKIKGEYDYDFNPEDMVVQPREVQFQQWVNFLNVVKDPSLTRALEDNDVDLTKVVVKVADLGGIDLNEVKRGGPIMLPTEQENQMFLAGMEVPDPSLRDPHPEHILSHDRTLQPLQAQLDAYTNQTQAAIDQVSKTQGMADPNDPQQVALVQQAIQKANEVIQQIQKDAQPIQEIVRKIKLHLQAHDQMQKDKEMDGLNSSIAPRPTPQPNQGPPSQMGMRNAAMMMQMPGGMK